MSFLGHLLQARSQDVLTPDRWLVDRDFVALEIPKPVADGGVGDVG